MALPELTTPPGTPPFRIAGHAIDPGSVYGEVPMGRGHGRKRRLWTTAPRTVEVSWRLTQAQMSAVHTWFEESLLVGSRTFAALVANQGPGLRWWEAKWVSPYKHKPMSGGRWVVTGQLRLTGEPSAEGPVPTSLRLEVGAALAGSALVVVGKPLAVEFVAALEEV